MKNRIFNISNIYLLLIALLQLQDVAYKGGSMLSKMIIAAFALLSIAVATYTILKYKLPRYFHWLNVLLLMFTLYGVIHILSTPNDYVWFTDNVIPSYSYLISIYLSMLPIYVFYVCCIKGELSQIKIQIWTILILILSIARFASILLESSSLDDMGEITNNYGYLFVGIIPLLIFFNNKTILQYILLVVCMIMVVISMKRGAILVAVCCLILFTVSLWKQSSHTKRIALTILIIAFIVGAAFFLSYMLRTNDYLLSRVEATLDGNSSLRDDLYRDFWTYFVQKASVFNQLFGGGANHTLQVSYNYAHNDWLEILINQGLIGVIIYLLYWLNFWIAQKQCHNIPELNLAKSGLTICFIASLLTTFFSMSYSNLSIGLTMTMGICLGQVTLYQTKRETIHA